MQLSRNIAVPRDHKGLERRFSGKVIPPFFRGLVLAGRNNHELQFAFRNYHIRQLRDSLAIRGRVYFYFEESQEIRSDIIERLLDSGPRQRQVTDEPMPGNSGGNSFVHWSPCQ